MGEVGSLPGPPLCPQNGDCGGWTSSPCNILCIFRVFPDDRDAPAQTRASEVERMKPRLHLALPAIALAALACSTTPDPSGPSAAATSRPSVFDSGRTAYGFFPSAPEPSLFSILETFRGLGRHADVILVQPNIAWEDFIDSPDTESQRITDILNQEILADQNGLEIILVVDPLNGLNRREFAGLPPDLA